MIAADVFVLVTSALVASLMFATIASHIRARAEHATETETITVTSRSLATETAALREEIEALMGRPIPGPTTYWCVAGSIVESIQERERRGIHPVNWNFVTLNATNLRGITLDPAHHTVVLAGTWRSRADLEAVLHEITVASLVHTATPDPES